MKPSTQRSLQASYPAKVRKIFGTDLKLLCQSKPSVSAISRDLGINHTQFNRYMAGDSFPRPDILHLICEYSSTDAWISLEPIGKVRNGDCQLLTYPKIEDFYTSGPGCGDTDMLPLGLYCFARQCFTDSERYIQGLSLVYQKQGSTFVRGLKASPAKTPHGATDTKRSREWRGFVIQQSKGISALISWLHSSSCSYMFLANPQNSHTNIWSGYCICGNPESTLRSRVTRLIFEYIGKDPATAFKTRRNAGCCGADALPLHQRKLLLLQQAFY